MLVSHHCGGKNTKIFDSFKWHNVKRNLTIRMVLPSAGLVFPQNIFYTRSIQYYLYTGKGPDFRMISVPGFDY
jgi:hypothetical protein